MSKPNSKASEYNNPHIEWIGDDYNTSEWRCKFCGETGDNLNFGATVSNIKRHLETHYSSESKASEGRYKVEDKTYDDLEEAKVMADMTDNPVLDSQEDNRPIYDGGTYRTESKASEGHIWGDWFSDNFKEEYTMDQSGTYRCKHCDAWFDMYMHSQEVAKHHLAGHGIVIGESKASEDWEEDLDGYKAIGKAYKEKQKIDKSTESSDVFLYEPSSDVGGVGYWWDFELPLNETKERKIFEELDIQYGKAWGYLTQDEQKRVSKYKSKSGESDMYKESWSQASSINRIEALEKIGIKQGDAIKLSSLEFEDFGEDLQGALKGDVEDARKKMKAQKAFLDKDEDNLADITTSTGDIQKFSGFKNQRGGEVENPNSEFDQSYPDYNNIGESQTTRTNYECEYCDNGFKSNEALSIHHNDKHAIAPESLDGYASEADCTNCGQSGVDPDPRFQLGSWCEDCQDRLELAKDNWWKNATDEEKRKENEWNDKPWESEFDGESKVSEYEDVWGDIDELRHTHELSRAGDALEDSNYFACDRCGKNWTHQQAMNEFGEETYESRASEGLDFFEKDNIIDDSPMEEQLYELFDEEGGDGRNEWPQIRRDFCGGNTDIESLVSGVSNQRSARGIKSILRWADKIFKSNESKASEVDQKIITRLEQGRDMFEADVDTSLWDLAHGIFIEFKLSSMDEAEKITNDWYFSTTDTGYYKESYSSEGFHDGKTFTCDKCGKVGDSFSDMAQEACPADVNANHQIPIFGDQVKPRGIGESKAFNEEEHTRDGSGQFTSGGSGWKTKEKTPYDEKVGKAWIVGSNITGGYTEEEFYDLDEAKAQADKFDGQVTQIFEDDKPMEEDITVYTSDNHNSGFQFIDPMSDTFNESESKASEHDGDLTQDHFNDKWDADNDEQDIIICDHCNVEFDLSEFSSEDAKIHLETVHGLYTRDGNESKASELNYDYNKIEGGSTIEYYGYDSRTGSADGSIKKGKTQLKGPAGWVVGGGNGTIVDERSFISSESKTSEYYGQSEPDKLLFTIRCEKCHDIIRDDWDQMAKQKAHDHLINEHQYTWLHIKRKFEHDEQNRVYQKMISNMEYSKSNYSDSVWESKASEDDGDKYNRDLDEIRDKAYDYVENNLSKFNLTEKDVDDWHNGNGFNGRYENTVNRVIDDMTYRLEKPLYESKASEGQFDPNIDDLWYTSDTTMRSKILSKSGITGGLSLATTEWDDLPLDIVIQLEEINVAALNESLASEDDPDYDNDADFEGKINGASVEPSQYTQSGMDHTDYGRGDIDESKSNEAGSEDHMCAECGFITSDNSEYIDHLNSHEE